MKNHLNYSKMLTETHEKEMNSKFMKSDVDLLVASLNTNIDKVYNFYILLFGYKKESKNYDKNVMKENLEFIIKYNSGKNNLLH